jgi:hypothetical protein
MLHMTNADLSPHEAIIDSITINNERCSGCQKTGTEFMITGLVKTDPRRDGPTFYDLFLTRAQVEALYREIGAALAVVEKRPTTST